MEIGVTDKYKPSSKQTSPVHTMWGHIEWDLGLVPVSCQGANRTVRNRVSRTSFGSFGTSSPRVQPYPRTKPRSLPTRAPRSQPQLINCHFVSRTSRFPRSSSISSASDSSLSSSDSELATPPAQVIDLPLCMTDPKPLSPPIFATGSVELLEASSYAYTFRTTIAPS